MTEAKSKTATHAAILDAAKKIFAAKGFGAATVRDICTEAGANKTWYYLMQIAWTLWQVFQRGFLIRLESGCRKMTQILWCEEIRTYIRHLGCVMMVPRHKLLCRKHL